MTTDIITTTTNDETTTKPSFAKRLCDSLERDSEMRAVSDDPDNAYFGDMSHMLDMLDDECDAIIRRAVYFTLQLAALDAICDLAVVALRESYLAGYREWPKTDVAVAYAYVDVLTDEIDKFVANDYLAYAPMSDISDTLDTIDYMVSAEASADEIVSLIQSILRDEHVTKLPESRKFHINDAEVADDTAENLDDLLRIGNMTVDDLLRRLPEGEGDKISIASALISGGLVCDPNGRVYIEAFEPTEASSNYPDHIADTLRNYHMSIMDTAFQILDLAADVRTVQLSPDMYATILGFSEVPDDVWAPYVADWEADPHAAKWARHERRWQAVVGAYEELYDAYKAEQGSPSGEDDEGERTVLGLDEYLVATGGWLKVEDEITGDSWLVNALDVFGFDDARTLADAGDLWNSSHYRVRRHESAKSAA